MMKKTNLILLLLVAAFSTGCRNDAGNGYKPPNILWITCEDMSPRLACYGDSTVSTPNIDRLAAEGMRFNNVFSISGVCSPSRSTLITGCYATTLGTMHQRTTESRNPFCDPYIAVPPPEVKGFPEYLRKHDYYCTNNSKTDYQFGVPFTIWDETSGNAHWRNRPDKDMPFFAVFNSERTHTGRIFTRDVWQRLMDQQDSITNPGGYNYFKGMRDNIDRTKYTDPADVPLPPYYADHPEIREEVAVQYDNIIKMDKWVGEILAQLEEDGLLDNTIVFYYSDHGTGLPRGKRWLYDSGLKVPMIIRWPGVIEPGSTNDELISFIDFAPTILSLAGADIPEFIQGRVFLGDGKEPEPEFIFAARDRIGEGYDKIRAVRDKQYKYLRNYIPDSPYLQDSWYRDNMVTLRVMRDLYRKGELNEVEASWLQQTKPEEELYDITTDPHEINNLAGDPAYAGILEKMRGALDTWKTETGDLGDMPEAGLRNMMWPDGSQPLTADPVVSVRETGEGMEISLGCSTEGASVGYRIVGPDDSAPWKIYNGPFILNAEQLIETRAIRYGFKESRIVRYADPGSLLYFPDDANLVDVTKSPYFADNTGQEDATSAIQQALDDHSPWGWHMIYLPAGEYLVSEQLRWGEAHRSVGPALQGQGRDHTIIRLADRCEGFQDRNHPSGVLWTGDGSADNFKNAVRDLTIITGKSNPGACGLQFNANNNGAVEQVRILSEDGRGVTGLDLSFTDMIGPLIVRNVEIEGFDYGIKTFYQVNSQTFEHVTLRNQNICGFVNEGQVVSIRGLNVSGCPVAVKNLAGDMVLIDSELSGTTDSKDHPAILNRANLFVRNVNTSQFRMGIKNEVAGGMEDHQDLVIDEFTSHAVLRLYDESPGTSMSLPIKEIPEVEGDDEDGWINAEEFGLDINDTLDDSQAIQAAIDNDQGKTTVYFPCTGPDKYIYIKKDVYIRGDIRRIFGSNAFVKGSGRIIFADGTHPVVRIERFARPLGGNGPQIVHEASRTLVVTDATPNGILGNGSGDLFIYNVVGGPHYFQYPGQHVWCRHLNSEQGRNEGITVDGSTVWVMGFKTEWDQVKFNTINGGRTEVLGAFVYALTRPKKHPMFRIEDAAGSFAGIRQTNFTNPPNFYEDIVLEVRDGEEKIMKREDIHSDAMPLFTGY